MYFEQSELLGGLDRGFVKEFMDSAEKATYDTGHSLFREGDPAGSSFFLLKGCVKITIGETRHTVYTVNRPGEIFGWSSLVGRDAYSASAECREETTLLRIDAERLNMLFEKNPRSGLIFFKRLAGVMGNRLLQTYRFVSNRAETDTATSFGTGQVQEIDQKVS